MRSKGQPDATLSRLATFSLPSKFFARERMAAMVAFGIVGVTGIVVNQTLLWLQVHVGHVNYLFAAVVATQGSTTWNFMLNELWVFRGRVPSARAGRRFLAFAGVNNATLLARVPMLALFVSVLHIHYLIANLITLVVLFVTRFALSDQLIWKAAAIEELEKPAGGAGRTDGRGAQIVDELAVRRARAQALRYRYDIHGFASVASEVELKELRYFQVDSPNGGADVEIRLGAVGMRPLRRVTVTPHPGGLSYQEQLGGLGANFRIDVADRIRVTVNPLLARSPHVVYTNVVEALLRFVLASRDRALLHSATLDFDGQGVMLSAHTDTGKTMTILRMLRDHGGVFLSDDMSVVTGDGRVFAYPKPLTISHHTLAALDRTAIRSWRERGVLRLKSSIHSKGGRATGMRLAALNLPIMSINAITQLVVPPPKYHVDRLVACSIGQWTHVRHLFLIGRGARRDETVGAAEALDTLVENTDDAYGFPPFRQVLPVLKLAGEDYAALRDRERRVLRRMLEGVSVERLVRDDFSWADEIPRRIMTLPAAVVPADAAIGDDVLPSELTA